MRGSEKETSEIVKPSNYFQLANVFLSLTVRERRERRVMGVVMRVYYGEFKGINYVELSEAREYTKYVVV